MTPRQVFRLCKRLMPAPEVAEDAPESPIPPRPPAAKGGKKRKPRLFENVRGVGFERYDCFEMTEAELKLREAGQDPTSDPFAAPIELQRERFYTMSLLFNAKQGNPPMPQLGLRGVEKDDLAGCRDWCDRVWAASEAKFQKLKESRDAVQGTQPGPPDGRPGAAPDQ